MAGLIRLFFSRQITFIMQSGSVPTRLEEILQAAKTALLSRNLSFTKLSPALGILAAILLAILAQLARIPLDPPTLMPYITYIPFIVGSAWLGGLAPGLLTTVLCTLESVYFAVAPVPRFQINDLQHLWGISVLAFSGAVISLAFDRLKRAGRDIIAANRELAAIQTHAPVGILVVDHELQVLKANRLAAEFAGLDSSEIVARDPGVALGCLHSLHRPLGCGYGPSCEQCRVRSAVLDSVRNGATHEGVEAWVPVSGDPVQARCFVISTAPLPSGSAGGALVCVQDVTAARLAEVELHRQADLVNLSHDAIITADADRRITGWNAGAQEMYGWTKAQALGQVMHQLLQTSGSTAEVDPILLREGRWDGELQHVARDRRRLTVESRQILVRGHDNRPAGILEINRDVTERSEAQQALRESEEQFRTLANAIPQLCWMANADGWIFWYNQRWYEYTGATPEQMEGWGWKSVHDPRTLPEVLERWSASIAAGEPLDMVFPLRGADGVFRPFLTRVMPVRGSDGKVARWFGTNTDISEQRRIQDALRQSEERLRLAQQAAGVGTFEWNLQTGVNTWTPEVERMHGLAPGAFSQTYSAWETLVHPEDRAAAAASVNESIETGSATKGEWRVLWPDGSVHWIAARWQVLKDAAGTPLRAIGVNLEITERKRLEAAIQESEQRVRHKLESILSPQAGIGELELTDILDLPAIQSLLNDFHELAHVPVAIIDLEGKVLVGVGWQEICTRFHRAHPETGQFCLESDTQLAAGVPPGQFKLYKCKNNLYDVATPLLIGGKHVGNIFSGQFLLEDEPLDRDVFRAQSLRYGFDECEYMASLDAVPRMNRAAVDSAIAFLSKFGQMIALLSYSNIRLAKSLASLEEAGRVLQSALTEKTILLKEVHHRVKNNLTIISSLLGMSANTSADPAARLALDESQRRVHSIALIHEHLYGNEHLDRINLAEYLHALVEELHDALVKHPQQVLLEIETDPIELGVHRAVPCSLILNELVSNAFKYAFPNGRSGRVDVTCREPAPGTVKLVVQDNGVGLPADLDWQKDGSLGLEIVRTLSRQLGATLEVFRDHGTRVELVFRYGMTRALHDPVARPDSRST